MSFGVGPTLISSFTGADEDPLSEGGNWAALNSSAGQMQRISNRAGGRITTGFSYWTPGDFGPDCEVYATIPTRPSAGAFAMLFARLQGAGGAGTFDGYAVSVEGSTTSVRLHRYTDATETTLVTASSTGFANGDKLGIRCVGSTIEAWRYSGGAWNRLTAATDATYALAGKTGMFISDDTARIDNLYAGVVSPWDGLLYWTRTKARRGRRFPTLVK